MTSILQHEVGQPFAQPVELFVVAVAGFGVRTKFRPLGFDLRADSIRRGRAARLRRELEARIKALLTEARRLESKRDLEGARGFMIEKSTATGFRCFREIHVEPLTRVNLFVGANNAGKTSLLEAVELVAVGGVEGLVRSAVRRGEQILARSENENGTEFKAHLIDPAHLSSVITLPGWFLLVDEFKVTLSLLLWRAAYNISSLNRQQTRYSRSSRRFKAWVVVVPRFSWVCDILSLLLGSRCIE